MVQAPLGFLDQKRFNYSAHVASDAPDGVTRRQRSGVQADQLSPGHFAAAQDRPRGRVDLVAQSRDSRRSASASLFAIGRLMSLSITRIHRGRNRAPQVVPS